MQRSLEVAKKAVEQHERRLERFERSVQGPSPDGGSSAPDPTMTRHGGARVNLSRVVREWWPDVLRVVATVGLLAVFWHSTNPVVFVLLLFVWVWGR